MKLPGVVAFVLMPACGWFGVSQKNWPDRSSNVSCHYVKRCHTADFWSTYDSVDQCVDETRDLLQDEADLYGGCTFSEESAADCLDAMGKSCKTIGQSYDALLSACFSVWDCSGPRPFDTGSTTSISEL